MRAACLPMLLLIAACGDDRPPAPTAEESDRLNAAEEMLNSFNEEGPAPESTGPSD